MIISEVFQTMVWLQDGSVIDLCDSVEYQGGLWLVPSWLSAPGDKYQYPERIIRFDVLSYAKLSENNEARYLLHHPLPKHLFDGQIPAGVRYEVVEEPDILVPIHEIH